MEFLFQINGEEVDRGGFLVEIGEDDETVTVGRWKSKRINHICFKEVNFVVAIVLDDVDVYGCGDDKVA